MVLNLFSMIPKDIETLERATIAAVSPDHMEELQGWLLPFDTGTVNRAKSAVPLRHAPFDIEMLHEIEARYLAKGLPPVFRLAAEPCFEGLRRDLARRGYQAGPAVFVQVASAKAMGQVSTGIPAEVSSKPDEAWAALFHSGGFDPVDGASRAKALRRATGSAYASVRENGKAVAAGTMAFSHGWSSVHGMRTAETYRGKGLARRMLSGLAHEALHRGFERVFLQVEGSNASALALYQRAGFATVWAYEYWTCAAT